MRNLYDSLSNYFENTPKEILDKDWKEIENLNKIGPDVIEYANSVKEQFGIALAYSNAEENLETHKYDVSVNLENSEFVADSKYFFAA